MSKYVCIQTCEWYNGGICVRNPCPYDRLRRLESEPAKPEEQELIYAEIVEKTRVIIGTDADGNEVRFKTATEASRALGLNKSAVTNAIHKKGRAGGFRWRKENE